MDQVLVQSKLKAWQETGQQFRASQQALQIAVETFGAESEQTARLADETRALSDLMDNAKLDYDRALRGNDYNPGTQKLPLPKFPKFEETDSYYGKLTAFPNTPKGRENASAFFRMVRSIAMKQQAPEVSAADEQYLQQRYGINMAEMKTRALAEAQNATGGVLVATEFSNAIIFLIEQFGVFREHAQLMPMTSDKLILPRYRQGVTSYWQQEGFQIPASTSELFDGVSLIAETLATIVIYSNQLGEDTMINLGDYYAKLCAIELAFREDQAGFLGAGEKSNGGITGLRKAFNDVPNNPGLYLGPAGSATDWQTFITRPVITKFRSKLRLYKGGKWGFFMSNGAYESVCMNIMLQGGGNTAPIIMNGMGGENGPVYERMFMNYPVHIVEVMPASEDDPTYDSTNGDIIMYFGDLSQAAFFGERRQLTMAVSREAGTLWENNQTGIRVDERIAINCPNVGGNLSPSGQVLAGPLIAFKTQPSA